MELKKNDRKNCKKMKNRVDFQISERYYKQAVADTTAQKRNQ